MATIGGVADQLSGRLGGIGGSLLGNLEGAAAGQAPGVQEAIAGLLGQAQNREPLLDFQSLLEPGAQLDAQTAALDQAVQRNLESTLGTLGSSAALAGGSGGDREAFFSSRAAEEGQRAFASAAADLFGQDLAARRGMAGTAAQLALGQQGQQAANLGQAGALGLQQQGQQIGAAQSGIGALGGLFNLGMAPFSAQFAPLQALAGILGGPTVLSAGENVSFGRSRSEQRSRATSRGQQSARGGGFQIAGF